MLIEITEYLKHVRHDYLQEYISAGGSALKFVACEDEQGRAQFHADLSSTARDLGYLDMAVDAADVRVHLVHEIYFALAAAADWDELVDGYLLGAYRELGVAANADLRVRAVAEMHALQPTELYRSIRRHLERDLLEDPGLSRDFRVAVVRLCQYRLDWGDVDAAERAAVLDWLTGRPVPPARLRTIGIGVRVTRHNARHMIGSLAHWVRRAGVSGLVLRLDIGRLGAVHRGAGNSYSKAMTVDAYEVLRQFVDSLDVLDGVLLAVVLPRTMVCDRRRGLVAYRALHQRVVSEVVDLGRPNPSAALVRVGSHSGRAA